MVLLFAIDVEGDSSFKSVPAEDGNEVVEVVLVAIEILVGAVAGERTEAGDGESGDAAEGDGKGHIGDLDVGRVFAADQADGTAGNCAVAPGIATFVVEARGNGVGEAGGNTAAGCVGLGLWNQGDRAASEEAAGFLSRDGVVDPADVEVEALAEAVIDFEQFLTGVEAGADGEEDIECALVAIGKLGKDVVYVGLCNRVDAGDAGVGTDAVGPLDFDADGLGELAALELGSGEEGVESVVGDHAAELVRPEEKSFVFDDRATEGVAEVIPAERGTGDVTEVVEEVVGGIGVVAIEPVDVAVEFVGTGAGDDVDLSGSTAPEFGGVCATESFEFGDGIDAGESEEREVGATVEVVGAVHHEGVTRGASAVEREGDDVGAAVRILQADVELVGSGGGSDARHEGEELDVVAIVERKFADFPARDKTFGRSVL